MFTITFGSGLLWAQGHCVNSVCMKGILADSHRLDLGIDGIQTQSCLLFLARISSEDSYEETDPYVDNLALVLLHTWWCCAPRAVSTLNDAPGNHYAIIDAVPFISWWGVTEATFSVGSVTPKISLCFMLPWEWEPSAAFGITFRKSWYRAMLNTHFLMSAPNIFHGWNGNTFVE